VDGAAGAEARAGWGQPDAGEGVAGVGGDVRAVAVLDDNERACYSWSYQPTEIFFRGQRCQTHQSPKITNTLM
jgi:hypothetical protein